MSRLAEWSPERGGALADHTAAEVEGHRQEFHQRWRTAIELSEDQLRRARVASQHLHRPRGS